MPDEMEMRSADSPAAPDGNTGGLANAVYDFVRDNAGSEDFSQQATREYNSPDASDNDGGYDDLDYDNIVNDVLGLEQKNPYVESVPDDRGAVPYERFREVNEKARQAQEYEDKLSRWGRVIEQFEQQGYTDADAVDAALTQQRVDQEDMQLRQYYANLAESQGVDPYVANMQMEAEMAKRQYERQMEEVNSYMLMQQRDVAVQQYPLANRAPAMVDNLIAAGFDPYEAAEAVHEQVRIITSSLIPEVAAKLKNQSRAPQPMGGGNSARMQAPQGGPAPRQGIASLLGISRNRNVI
jgi:hypothetical protein